MTPKVHPRVTAAMLLDRRTTPRRRAKTAGWKRLKVDATTEAWVDFNTDQMAVKVSRGRWQIVGGPTLPMGEFVMLTELLKMAAAALPKPERAEPAVTTEALKAWREAPEFARNAVVARLVLEANKADREAYEVATSAESAVSDGPADQLAKTARGLEAAAKLLSEAGK